MINNSTNTATQTIPIVPGTPFEGGFYVGRFQVGGIEYALIVSPKAEGELEEAAWGPPEQSIENASYADGWTNTNAMAATNNDLARWILALDINGFSDWYLPSRDELELCYRNLKPTTDDNYTSFRDGDNPSSLPAGYPYTKSSPLQTAASHFREDGEQAFERAWYWTSTQYSPDTAWIQYFNDGNQGNVLKDYARRARAVRRLPIKPQPRELTREAQQ